LASAGKRTGRDCEPDSRIRAAGDGYISRHGAAEASAALGCAAAERSMGASVPYFLVFEPAVERNRIASRFVSVLVCHGGRCVGGGAAASRRRGERGCAFAHAGIHLEHMPARVHCLDHAGIGGSPPGRPGLLQHQPDRESVRHGNFHGQLLAGRKDGKWKWPIFFLTVTLLRSLSKATILSLVLAEGFLMIYDKSMSRKKKVAIAAVAVLLIRR